MCSLLNNVIVADRQLSAESLLQKKKQKKKQKVILNVERVIIIKENNPKYIS